MRYFIGALVWWCYFMAGMGTSVGLANNANSTAPEWMHYVMGLLMWPGILAMKAVL